MLLVPLLGLGEWQLHLAQTRSAVDAADLAHARSQIGDLGPDDGLAFTPRWLDPAARAAFPDVLVEDVERAAPTDYLRYARVFELARGASDPADPALADWPVTSEREVGALTLRVRDNPQFSPVDALLSRAGTDKLSVTQEGAPCPLQQGRALAGAWSPPTPATRYACNGGAVGVVVIPDLDYRLRRCLLIPAGPNPVRLRFHGVGFGQVLRLAHGLHVEGERPRAGAPVELRVLVQVDSNEESDGVRDVELAQHTHTDGDGWQVIEVPTPKLRGQVGDLHLEIHSAGARRPYCLDGFAR